MNAGELCNRHVITASRNTNIYEAAQLMRDKHVGSLIITEQKDNCIEPIGILTDRDIVVEVLAENVAPETVNVGDIMTSAVIKVSEEDSILDTAQRMRARGVRRVPVVSNQCELLGVLALDDILALLSEELSLLAKVTMRETEQEIKKRSRRCD
jgi:signal-transduction protein with cAMP-binding, CBS, and nucleotidyltransferase domain